MIPPPVTPAPPPLGQCGDKLGNKCNHMPGNVYADMPRHGGFCQDKKCTLEECAERVAAKVGTDVCPNPNIFIYSSQYNICKCQYKQRSSPGSRNELSVDHPLASFCDRDGSSTGAGQYTYNLAGCLATTTTTQAPAAASTCVKINNVINDVYQTTPNNANQGVHFKQCKEGVPITDYDECSKLAESFYGEDGTDLASEAPGRPAGQPVEAR